MRVADSIVWENACQMIVWGLKKKKKINRAVTSQLTIILSRKPFKFLCYTYSDAEWFISFSHGCSFCIDFFFFFFFFLNNHSLMFVVRDPLPNRKKKEKIKPKKGSLTITILIVRKFHVGRRWYAHITYLAL